MSSLEAQTRGELTRKRLIEAGVRAMTLKSYHAVGLSEVLDAADVPKGSFYHHFKNKEDFGVAVIEHAIAECMEWLREQMSDTSLSPIERLYRLFLTAGNEVCDSEYRRDCLICKLILEVGSLSEPMRIALKRGLELWRAELATCLREAQTAGELSCQVEPECLAEYISNAWEGSMIRLQVDRDRHSLDGFLKLTFDCLLKQV